MALMQLLPQNWHSWDFNVDLAGTTVGEIRCTSSWMEKATLKAGDADYQAFREYFVGGDYLLQDAAGNTIARARKPSLLRSTILVECSRRAYTLKKESFTGKTYLLMEQDQQVGHIRTTGLLSRKSEVSLPDDLPLPEQLFVLWLVTALWQRDNGAANAAIISAV
jgi:hypothetical protein